MTGHAKHNYNNRKGVTSKMERKWGYTRIYSASKMQNIPAKHNSFKEIYLSTSDFK